MRSHRALIPIVTLLVVIALAGCGGEKPSGNDLSGKVTVNGQPAGGVRVLLTAPDGTTYSGITDSSGSFTIAQVNTEGEMKVSFEPPPDPSAGPAAMMKKNKDAAKDAKLPDVQSAAGAAQIPAKFRSPKTSGQTWSVNKDNRVKNFDLAG